MNWTEAQLSEYMEKRKNSTRGPLVALVAEKAKAAPKKRGMNTWESQYAQHLEMMKRAGLITWWAFEPMKFRLATGAYYKPDFAVINARGILRLVEVKGKWREAAMVRFKVVAEHFPFNFIAVSKEKNGEWVTIKELNQ